MTDTTPVIVSTYPTTKEQVVSYGLALAYTAVVTVVIVGGFVVVGAVTNAVENRRAKKAAKNQD